MNLLSGGHTIIDTANGTPGDRMDEWPSPVENEQLPCGWLSTLARDFAVTYEVSEFGAAALVISAVGAAAGGCTWLRRGDGLAVAPPLNMLFVGTGGSFRSAADNAWSISRARLGNNPKAAADIVTVRRQIIDLQTRLGAINQQIGDVDALRLDFGGFEQNRSGRARLLKEQEQIKQNLMEIGGSTGQRLLVEGGPLGALLLPGDLSIDGAVHNLSANGTIVARLAAAPARLLADLGEVTARVWTERFASAAPAANHGELLSHTLVLSQCQAAAFLGSRRIRTSGLIDQFLMIDLRCAKHPPANPPAGLEVAWAEFAHVCNELAKARETLVQTVYGLNREAEEEIGRYVHDRNASAKGLAPRQPAIFDRMRTLVSKFCLALHLCGEHRGEQLVGVKTVKAACFLADAAFSGHLALYRELALPEQTSLRQERDDVEVIVERLRIRGPLNRRQLAQSFHDQKTAHWEPMLAQAIASGKVARLADGRFDLLQKDE